jgi:hypothetical protein
MCFVSIYENRMKTETVLRRVWGRGRTRERVNPTKI